MHVVLLPSKKSFVCSLALEMMSAKLPEEQLLLVNSCLLHNQQKQDGNQGTFVGPTERVYVYIPWHNVFHHNTVVWSGWYITATC